MHGQVVGACGLSGHDGWRRQLAVLSLPLCRVSLHLHDLRHFLQEAGGGQDTPRQDPRPWCRLQLLVGSQGGALRLFSPTVHLRILGTLCSRGGRQKLLGWQGLRLLAELLPHVRPLLLAVLLRCCTGSHHHVGQVEAELGIRAQVLPGLLFLPLLHLLRSGQRKHGGGRGRGRGGEVPQPSDRHVVFRTHQGSGGTERHDVRRVSQVVHRSMRARRSSEHLST
mmetsp:Transcript_37290/g.107050  ORF Transcript_37290/g.107050 Transcript_37290/m.107050 type:complete len:224 (+) Transcript_37290:250-921(+)